MAATNVNKYISSRLNGTSGIHLGERTLEVKPVGAWVQPISSYTDFSDSAVMSAQLEENRIKNIQFEKEAKLKKFQDEVRTRVQALQKMKAQQQLQKSYKAVEVERNMIKQSASAAEKNSARKNHCKMRVHSAHVLSAQPPDQSATAEGRRGEDTEDPGMYAEQSHQVHTFTAAARRSLVSRTLAASGASHVPDRSGTSVSVQPAIPSPRDSSAPQDFRIEESRDQLLETGAADAAQAGGSGDSRTTRRPASGCGRAPAAVRVTVPDIYPGVAGEEERQQAVTQRAIYRRLFMDMEREQVRDTLRRREHLKRMQVLKREKEEERKRVEDAATKILEPVDPLTGQSVEERLEAERSELEELQLSHEHSQRRLQKNRETERFVGALRSRLREKMAARQVALPALCCCGDSIWDTSPDTCANNCVFYRNPRAYAKALECVLASCEAV